MNRHVGAARPVPLRIWSYAYSKLPTNASLVRIVMILPYWLYSYVVLHNFFSYTIHSKTVVHALSPITGCPVVVMPLGHDSHGLPFGVLRIARRWEDERLLMIAKRVTSLTAGRSGRMP
jgi:hypothetical protein